MKLMPKTLALALVTALMAFAGPGLGAEREKVIPEIWVGATAHCILRADIPGDALEQRKQRVLSFIRRASADRMAWNLRYFLFDVDYMDFASFGIIAFDDCAGAARLLEQIAALFGDCRPGEATPCVGGELRLLQLDQSPFVVRDGSTDAPVARFENIKGREALPRCAIAAAMKDSVRGDDDAWTKSSRALWALVTKYRMPLMDIFAADNRHYFLFSRLCDQKEELFEEMKALLMSDGYDWDKYFHDPDFAPNVSAYRFAQIGARGLPPPPGRSTW